MEEKIGSWLPETRCGRRVKRNLGLALLLAVLMAQLSASHAVPLVGTDGTKLYKFDSATPGTVTTLTITGLIPGDALIGIDYHPATAQLYGIGVGRIYLINPTTGAASSVGGPNPGFSPNGGTFGTDISAIDGGAVRLVSNTHQNIRINLINATVATTDTSLTYNGTPSNIAAIATTNAFAFASTVTCFGIGSLDGQLLRIGSANGSPNGPGSGVVTKLGSLGIGTNLNQNIGFDIAPNGTAYAAIVFGGQLRLYTINLNTAAATLVGAIAGGATSFRGLTAEAGPKLFSNTTQILIPKPVMAGEFETEAANPYPSVISVSGMSGTVTKLRVFFNDFRHKEPREVPILLVGPEVARKMVIFTGVGGDFTTCGNICNNMSNLGSAGPFVGIDDYAINFLPQEARLSETPYGKPTDHSYEIFASGQWGGVEVFPAPAPGGPYSYPGPFGTSTLTSTFYGGTANGNWSLYVKDVPLAASGEEDPTGRIANGWAIEVTTGPACTIGCSNLTRSAMPGMCGAMVNYPAPNVTGACGTITYSIPSGSVFPVGITPVEITSQFGQKCTFNVDVQDFQPPVITCNQDITVQAAPGASSAVVTYPDPMASDNCAVTATYNPPSGSTFPLGTTTVTGTATDSSQSSISCTFKVTVVDGGPAPSPTPPGPGTKLANISTRLRVETGDNGLIGGFIITGAEPKRVIVRALGPSIPVPGVLPDPLLQMFDSNGGLIATNDNWQDAPNAQEIIDSTIAPSNNLEAAFLSSLNPGAYTAVVSGVGGTTGVGLVEVYDLNLNANSKLANISTRGLVQTGDNVLIAGTIVLGQASQNVIVRAIGPSLPIAGKLENPTLELRDSNGGLIQENDNWVDSPNKQAIIDSTIPPSNDLESAIVATLSANGASYTAVVRGVNNTTGIAVVEIYALQ